MEFFRAGEALIRSSQPLLLPFLAPTASRSPARIGAISTRCPPQRWQCQSNNRAFSSSSSHLQQSSIAAKQIQELADSIQPQRREESRNDFTDLLDGALDLDKGVPGAPTGRTSRFSSITAQRNNQATSDRRPSNPRLSSVDEVLANMGSGPATRQSRTPPSSATTSPRSGLSQSQDLGLDLDSILNSAGNSTWDLAPEAKAPEATNDPAPFRLNSTTGRTIRLNPDRGVDAARAFRMLGMRLSQNSVRKDAQRQRFHERPGLRRKRLKSERWRKRFKEAFKGTVAKVVALKRQGW